MKRSQRSARRRVFLVTAALLVLAVNGCAPRQPYRPVPRPAPSSPPEARVPTPPPAPVEPARPAPPPESPIREEELTSKSRPAPSLPPAPEKLPPQEKPRESLQPPEPAVPPPLADDSSLLAKITPATPPQRAASLRLTEQGRKLLEAGDAARAVSRFERTISIDSTNPYGYFYLAKAQHRLGRHKESLNFLDVAESRLAGEPFWLSEVYALRGENFRALGMTEKAEASYAQALRLNSGNRTALEARSKLSGESQPASP